MDNSNIDYKATDKNPIFIKDLIETILLFLFCHMITGSVSLVFIVKANSSFSTKDYKRYREQTNIAKVARLLGWATHLILIIILIILYVIGLVSIASVS